MEKVEKVHFSFALVRFDTLMQQNLNSRGKVHLVTLAEGHMSVVSQHFPRASLKLKCQFELNVICSS